eukprot:3069653-Lingulodinium_polyedra.AAC.1
MLPYAARKRVETRLSVVNYFPLPGLEFQTWTTPSRVIEHARKTMKDNARDTTVQYFRWGPLDPHARVR